jgi:hypothetical protein
MKYTSAVTTTNLTLAETLCRLSAAQTVDGLALFGSQRSKVGAPEDQPSISDYDLLVLVKELPVAIFQLLTSIDGRMADVVFYPTTLVDQLDQERKRVAATSFEGYFLQKMYRAQILADKSGRLARAQRYVQSQTDPVTLYLPTSASEQYHDWFWLNHSLVHIQRMAQSSDPIYLAAVDLMLMGTLASLCRIYYRLRNLPWEGEKAALRTLQVENPDYFILLQTTLSVSDRQAKLSYFAQLVSATLQPVGELWQAGTTAVYLRKPSEQPTLVTTAIEFWEALLV